MAEPIPPLDPRVLEELGAEAVPPPGTQARVRARLETAIPEMRGPAGGGGGGSGSGAAGPLGRYAMSIGTFVLGGMAGAALTVALVRPPPPRVVYVDRPSPGKAFASTAGAEASAPAPSPGPTPTSAPAAVTLRAEPASSASQLAAERRLLDVARADLAQAEPERALARLGVHQVRYPRGFLSEERDAMAVQALVKLGRYDEARARASAFRERAPNSLFRSTVESAIESISVTSASP